MDAMTIHQTKEETLSIITSFCKEEVTSFLHLNGILANISAFLYHTLPDVNWVGFYYLHKDGTLILGPFQGEVACMTLNRGKGVCQQALEDKIPVVVGDVHLFTGHIACDSKSQSEAVIPILVDNHVVAVLDVDSPHKNHFNQDLIDVLEMSGKILSALCREVREYLDFL